MSRGVLALALPAVLVARPAHAAELVESEPNDHTSSADVLPLATTIPKDSRLTLQMVFPSGLVGGAYEVTLYDGSGGRRGSWELEGTDSTSAKVTVARLTPKVTASKATVKSGARARLSVSVATSATARPTGTVTVKVAGKTVRVKVSAKAKGKVKVLLPKITKRGTHKVTVTFSPSGSTKVSTKARTVKTTVRVR